MELDNKICLVTGSAGLIGSESCYFFKDKGYKIVGIDNDMRSYFFGENSSTSKSLNLIKKNIQNYTHFDVDIRNYDELLKIFLTYSSDIELIIHTAAQPSHDWAAKEPLTDFTINSLGTMNLLELTRLYCPKSTFIFTSTNKVYGDNPNKLKHIIETDTRWECTDGSDNLIEIDETMSIDNTKHSIFGASKVSADIMCQEYGKYFDMNIGVFRGGCLTGPNHASSELHGFLSYLVKCIVSNKPYTIYGYKGKQVRDNIHSYDLVNMFWHFHNNPKKGEVYNVGGGRNNSISILEAIETINKLAETNWDNYIISDKSRIGDHIWYISDLTKFKKDFPLWEISYDLNETLRQMVINEKNKIYS
jgi:CDP-paratose 2-epimerase